MVGENIKPAVFLVCGRFSFVNESLRIDYGDASLHL